VTTKRPTSPAQRVVLVLVGAGLLGLLAWDITGAIRLGPWHTIERIVLFVGWCRIADLLITPLLRGSLRLYIRRISRKLRLLRDARRSDPIAGQRITKALRDLDSLAETAKHL
jgi:hypothetical protein